MTKKITNLFFLWLDWNLYTIEGLPGGKGSLVPQKILEFLPCSPKISQDVPLNSLLLSSPVPKNYIACFFNPKKYSLMFPKAVPNIFQFLMVSYLHNFYLAIHSRQTNKQHFIHSCTAYIHLNKEKRTKLTYSYLVWRLINWEVFELAPSYFKLPSSFLHCQRGVTGDRQESCESLLYLAYLLSDIPLKIHTKGMYVVPIAQSKHPFP